jgi:ankyrin repeat protein
MSDESGKYILDYIIDAYYVQELNYNGNYNGKWIEDVEDALKDQSLLLHYDPATKNKDGVSVWQSLIKNGYGAWIANTNAHVLGKKIIVDNRSITAIEYLNEVKGNDTAWKGLCEDLNKKYNDSLPLSKIYVNGHEKVVEFLVEQEKKHVYIRQNGIIKPLIAFAAEKGDLDFVKLLLEKGADINAKSREGKTALFEACYYGHEKVAEFLLEKGAKFDFLYDLKPLIVHVAEKGHLEVVKLLLENGVDINAKFAEMRQGNTYKTALSEAVYGGHKSLALFLLSKGAGVYIRAYCRKDGYDKLILAVVQSMEGWDDVAAYVDRKNNPDKALAMAINNTELGMLPILIAEAESNPQFSQDSSDNLALLAKAKDLIEADASSSKMAEAQELLDSRDAVEDDHGTHESTEMLKTGDGGLSATEDTI